MKYLVEMDDEDYGELWKRAGDDATRNRLRAMRNSAVPASNFAASDRLCKAVAKVRFTGHNQNSPTELVLYFSDAAEITEVKAALAACNRPVESPIGKLVRVHDNHTRGFAGRQVRITFPGEPGRYYAQDKTGAGLVLCDGEFDIISELVQSTEASPKSENLVGKTAVVDFAHRSSLRGRTVRIVAHEPLSRRYLLVRPVFDFFNSGDALLRRDELCISGIDPL